MSTFRKTYELLRLKGQIKEPFAEANRNGPIAIAMHDQKRSPDPHDAEIRAKLISQEPAHRHVAEVKRSNVHHRRVRRFQNQLLDRVLCGQSGGNAGSQREAPRNDLTGIVSRLGESIGGRGILKQPLLARYAA